MTVFCKKISLLLAFLSLGMASFLFISACEDDATDSGRRNHPIQAMLLIDGDSLRLANEEGFWLPSISTGSPVIVPTVGQFRQRRDSIIRNDTLIITRTTAREGRFVRNAGEVEFTTSFVLENMSIYYTLTPDRPELRLRMPFPSDTASVIELLGGTISLEWQENNRKTTINNVPLRLRTASSLETILEFRLEESVNSRNVTCIATDLRFSRRNL